MPKFAPLWVFCLIAGGLRPRWPGRHKRGFVVSDGLRWQEVFQGADLCCSTPKTAHWVEDAELKARYWRDSPQERRELLLPFTWGTVARRGQVFGNRTRGSDAHVTTGPRSPIPATMKFSVGFPQPGHHQQ